jgi:hypothetical protein
MIRFKYPINNKIVQLADDICQRFSYQLYTGDTRIEIGNGQDGCFSYGGHLYIYAKVEPMSLCHEVGHYVVAYNQKNRKLHFDDVNYDLGVNYWETSNKEKKKRDLERQDEEIAACHLTWAIAKRVGIRRAAIMRDMDNCFFSDSYEDLMKKAEEYYRTYVGRR